MRTSGSTSIAHCRLRGEDPATRRCISPSHHPPAPTPVATRACAAPPLVTRSAGMKAALVITVVVAGIGIYFLMTRRKLDPSGASLWKEGPSIHEFIARNLDPVTGALKPDAADLPDEA